MIAGGTQTPGDGANLTPFGVTFHAGIPTWRKKLFDFGFCAQSDAAAGYLIF